MAATILSPAKAAEVRSSARRRDPEGLLAALVAGQTVHFDDDRSHFNSKHVASYGLRLRSLAAPDGGRYYWTEPLVEVKSGTPDAEALAAQAAYEAEVAG